MIFTRFTFVLFE